MASSDKFDVDDALFRLQNNTTMDLTESEIKDLCLKAKEIFLSRPSLLGLQAPISVCGSLHGHYEDLLLLFEKCGPPPSVNYLFLGNYVNIGKQSVRTASLLLAYTIRYPEHVHLLRGDHEVVRNDHRGFRDECKRLYNVRVWKTFMDCFGCLPFAATVNDKIFCVNGGLSPELASVDQIRDILRPTDVPDKGLLCDLLFSDPAKDVQGWAENDSGTSVKFGLDVVREFLTRHNFDLVCRSRRFVQTGYEFTGERRELVTIFSAPDFGHRDFDILGSVMKVDESSSCSFFLMNPAYRVREDSKQIKDRPSLYSNCNAL